jgi:branched-chain amino acid transport system substrate-binding protein
MASSAELAFAEASCSGKLLGGKTVVGLRADSTFLDAAAACSAIERLITANNVMPSTAFNPPKCLRKFSTRII